MGFLSVRSIAVSSAAQDQTGHPDHPDNHPPRFLGANVPAKLMPKDAFYPQY